MWFGCERRADKRATINERSTDDYFRSAGNTVMTTGALDNFTS